VSWAEQKAKIIEDRKNGLWMRVNGISIRRPKPGQGGRPSPFEWTIDRDKELATLWLAGKSYQQIAKILNAPSQNSVHSRIRVLRLPKRSEMREGGC